MKAIFPVALGEQTADGKFSQTFFEELRDGKVSWPASDGYPDKPGSYPASEGRLPDVVSARSAAKAREFLGLLEPPVELSEELTVKAAVDEVLTSQAMLVPGRNRYGVQGAHLNPPGLFLRTSTPFIWCILSAFLPA